MVDILLALVVVAILLLVWQGMRFTALNRRLADLSEAFARQGEERHRAMLVDLHQGLGAQSDRLSAALADTSERLRTSVAAELGEARQALHSLQLALSQNLGENRAALLEKLAAAAQAMTGRIDERLDQISGRVGERLEEGFKKTNETFTNVMQRLATIDEAQKKIDGLASNVVGLQELLGDKRSRGAFGEVQLEALVRNMLPPQAYALQATLSNRTRVDCLLKLPEPTGRVAVDSKFPLENYHRMFVPGAGDAERAAAQRDFKSDLRRHVQDICNKYIVPGETSDGAVMFVPAESVFAEIHAYHPEIVDYALQRRVWIVSPTTLMAVLNTARAVIKDVETRRQVHIIQEELAKLGRDFGRFDERMKRLAEHIRQAHEDAEQVRASGRKISERFASIESVQIAERETAPLCAAEAGAER